MVQFKSEFWHPSIATDIVLFTIRNKTLNILLAKRKDNGMWAIPGGFLKKGETLRQCAERELKEEAGISRGWFLALSPKCYIICEKDPCDLEKKLVAKENEFRTLEILDGIKEEPENTIKKKSAKGCNRKIPLR